MNGITVAWSMGASACLTLAVVCFFIGVRQRAVASLVFALMCCSAAALAFFELGLMHADTPERYGRILQGAHVPVFVLVASLVLFVRMFFGAGRLWLAWATVAARGAALEVNFLRHPNLNFDAITGLRQVSILGQSASVAEGVVSRWILLGQLSSLLLVAFLMDATLTVWRRNERRRAAVIGGSMIFFVLGAAGQTALLHAGVFRLPYSISLVFLLVVAAMSYELTLDVLRARELSQTLRTKDAALRESESRLSLAMEAANLSVWTWDVARDEVQMTDAERRLRGLGSEAPIDIRRFFSTVHPDDRDQVQQSVQKSLETGGTFEREFRIALPDGKIRWITSRGRVELGATGQPSLVRTVSIDVTSRKLAELEVERQRTELAHLSRFTILGELSGSLAHELNQPLTAILSNAQAAQRFLPSKGAELNEVREILEDIVAEDRRAGEIILRLRRLFKKGEVRPEPLDLGDIVRDVLRMVRSDLINHGVSVATELPETLPRVRGDLVQIQQVLLNLVKNACDSMDGTGTEERRLTLRAGVNGGDEVKISVTDTGRGIPPDVLDRLFEPFVTTKLQGMGLGLALCRNIIQAHEGVLRGGNNAGRGATFEFTLPAAGKEIA